MKKSELYNQILNSVKEPGSLERFKQNEDRVFTIPSVVDPPVTIYVVVSYVEHYLHQHRVSVFIEMPRPKNAYDSNTDPDTVLFNLDNSHPFGDVNVYDVYQNNPKQFAIDITNTVANISEKIKIFMDNRHDLLEIPFNFVDCSGDGKIYE